MARPELSENYADREKQSRERPDGPARPTMVEARETIPVAKTTELPGQRESICAEADRLVSEDRQKDYGHPLDDFGKTAKIWSAILGCPVTEEQVALCMIGVKQSRLCNTPDHRDSLVDIAGYAKTHALVTEERKRRG